MVTFDRKCCAYLGAIVMDARRCSVTTGASRLVLWKSPSRVFWRKPQDRFMRSDTSLMSDAGGFGLLGAE